jgi:hypothetical protein
MRNPMPKVRLSEIAGPKVGKKVDKGDPIFLGNNRNNYYIKIITNNSY